MRMHGRRLAISANRLEEAARVSGRIFVVSRITRMKWACVKEPCLGAVMRAGALAPNDHVLQHEAGAAGAADAVAEIIRRAPRVGADPHLVEGVIAAAADHRAQDTR